MTPGGARSRAVLATRNPHKVEELQRILVASGLVVELLTLDSFADVPEVAETGATFADNALLKARAVADATGLPALADDSGLCVDALNGMPGVLSARWAGRHGGDRANLDLVLAQLAEVPDDRLAAHFACAAAVAVPGGDGHVTMGRVEGRLVRAARGTYGFGYDPIFVPDEAPTGTFGEQGPEVKDAISHRARAFLALTPFIAAALP